MNCVEIPTNRPVIRIDEHDEIYRTAKEKYNAIINTILDCHKRNQPVLVGTTSIEKSELLADLLRAKSSVRFEVLNARHHEREAAIVAQAGVPGAITIATNMAGRGTDIPLGGDVEMRLKETLKGDETPEQIAELRAKIKSDVEKAKEEALAAGGLYVIGTERHESRRIDNQLRGRSGRQGDPGHSKFFLSLEDDLMRIFGSERMSVMLQRLGLPEGEALVHPFITKALEKAQRKVEERNFDIRKNLLKYDNVMNDQRKVIYEQRKELMESEDVSDTIQDMRDEFVDALVHQYAPYGTMPSEWNLEGLAQELNRTIGMSFPLKEMAQGQELTADMFAQKIVDAMEETLTERNKDVPAQVMRFVEKSILLQVLDQLWKDHIAALELMRHTIVLRAYGQKDPLNEYKREAFNMFSYLLDQLREKVTFLICNAQIQSNSAESMNRPQAQQNYKEVHETPESVMGGTTQARQQEEGEKQTPFQYKPFDANDPTTWGKVARNDSCPCGSGKKFKHCHGKFN